MKFNITNMIGLAGAALIVTVQAAPHPRQTVPATRDNTRTGSPWGLKLKRDVAGAVVTQYATAVVTEYAREVQDLFLPQSLIKGAEGDTATNVITQDRRELVATLVPDLATTTVWGRPETATLGISTLRSTRKPKKSSTTDASTKKRELPSDNHAILDRRNDAQVVTTSSYVSLQAKGVVSDGFVTYLQVTKSAAPPKASTVTALNNFTASRNADPTNGKRDAEPITKRDAEPVTEHDAEPLTQRNAGPITTLYDP